MVSRRADDPDGAPRISPAGRHAGRSRGAVRKAALPFRNGRGRQRQAGLAALCLRRSARRDEPRRDDRGHLPGTRSPLIPAGTIHGMPRPACCRRSCIGRQAPCRRTAAGRIAGAAGAVRPVVERRPAGRSRYAADGTPCPRSSARLAARPTGSRRTASRPAIRCGRSAGSGGC